jgi:hypothetical protein
MNRVKIHGEYPNLIDVDTEKDVDLFLDCFEYSNIPDGNIRIILLQEPFNPELFRIVQNNQDKYNYVLTYQEELLRNNPKSVFFMGTSTWIKGYGFPKKKFGVSTLVGGKVNPAMMGYALRHKLWMAQDQITIPKEFFLSSHCRWKGVNYDGKLVLGDSKFPLFDSQFYIVIENTAIKYGFSEKLIDCFQTKTVPIYWGCTNTGDYFNSNGILVVCNLEEIISICNILTPETYERLLPVLEDNYKASFKYCVYEEQLTNAVVNLIR